MRRVRHLPRTRETPGGWVGIPGLPQVGDCREFAGTRRGTEHRLGLVALVSSARCGRKALSSVANRFEACWGGAFLVRTSEQCRPAASLCGVCAIKLTFLGVAPSSSGDCHVGARRCQRFRFVVPAGAPVSGWRTCFVHSRVRGPLPRLRLSWASVRLAAFFPRGSMPATMKSSGESFCSGRVAPSTHSQWARLGQAFRG